MFGSLIDYWFYTGDDTHNDLVIQGMQFQVGPNNDYMPPNQTKTLGNDDQCFWALSAMSAAETNFPNPPKNMPHWLALAQAVFNTQTQRWHTATCGGGLKWQIYTFNNGYTYKNTISNGCFFTLAARLALYTRNQTYADWADRTWDWMVTRGLVDQEYTVSDGSDELEDCSVVNAVQWSYNSGILLNGAAAMYNYVCLLIPPPHAVLPSHPTLTFIPSSHPFLEPHRPNNTNLPQTAGAEPWYTHTTSLLHTTTTTFFSSGIMHEPSCEPTNTCNTDQLSFKAYLSRWLASTTKLAPFTFPTIKPLLRSSASAAMAHCSGGLSGRVCGLKWVQHEAWDGSEGVGQQMAALEVLQTNLIEEVEGPVTEEGGSSLGDPSAGSTTGKGRVKGGPWAMGPGTGDRVGAWVVTVVVVGAVVAGTVWVSV